ncbi:MAG TPA: hypothetical protein VFR97_02035 [Capillimicrobium sp.]|nr:hypothetical protein [Capillimicrobium sp.]
MGAAGSLVAAGASALLAVSAVVAFRGWPDVADADADAVVPLQLAEAAPPGRARPADPGAPTRTRLELPARAAGAVLDERGSGGRGADAGRSPRVRTRTTVGRTLQRAPAWPGIEVAPADRRPAAPGGDASTPAATPQAAPGPAGAQSADRGGSGGHGPGGPSPVAPDPVAPGPATPAAPPAVQDAGQAAQDAAGAVGETARETAQAVGEEAAPVVPHVAQGVAEAGRAAGATVDRVAGAGAG